MLLIAREWGDRKPQQTHFLIGPAPLLHLATSQWHLVEFNAPNGEYCTKLVAMANRRGYDVSRIANQSLIGV